MRHLLAIATSAMLTALTVPARADTIDDPLHGFVIQNGINVNTDNGNISPVQLANPNVTGFGFFASPAPQTGNLIIAVLIPTNLGPMLSVSVTGTLAGTATPHAGFWTSGDLADFLGLANATPSNPFSAFAGPDTADPNGTPTGFLVLTASLSATATLQDLSLSTMLEHIGGLPAGAEIAAFLVEPGKTVATAPSGVLEVTPFAAVPGPLAGAGLPGIGFACMALWGLHKRRRQRQA